MELVNKKSIIVTAAIVVVIVIVVVAFVVVRQWGSSPSTANNNPQSAATAGAPSTSAPITATHLPVPASVVVPEAGSKNVSPGVAVPQVEAAASPTGDNKYRSFNIIVENGQFMPNTIAVNLGDIVNLEISAVGADYDFTQPDYSISVSVPQNENVRKEFQANVSGKFVFYCSLCGGPAKGPVGYLIVTGQ